MTTAGSGADEPAAPQSLWQRLTYLLWRGPGARRVGRYALVNGAFGVPASIAQIALMIFVYEQAVGPANTVVLNLLFVVDLELTLTRNYLLNSRFIWGIAPSWKRFQHAHVATIGAWLVGLVAFNVTIWLTDSALLGRLASAIASFPAAYIYNDLRTFRR